MFEQKKKENTTAHDKSKSKNSDRKKAMTSVPGYVFDGPAGGANPAEGVIQRAQEGKVGVTLSPLNVSCTADQLYVDDITLSGRFKTELKTEGNKSTEGAHTIADVLIKKYQKDMARGRTLSDAFQFYLGLANEIKAESSFAVNHVSDSRFQKSQDYADKTIWIISGNAGAQRTFRQWNVIFKEIISSYNNAYARSYQATLGVGTAGKGEGQGIKYGLKRTKRNVINEHTLGNERRLIDLESVGQLDQESFVDMAGMNSIAGISIGEAIDLMGHQREIFINESSLDSDMAERLQRLEERLQARKLSPSDLTVARYLTMLAAIKARWAALPDMQERSVFRNSLDAAWESTKHPAAEGSEVTVTKNDANSMMASCQKVCTLLQNCLDLGEQDFIHLVDMLDELVGFAEDGRLPVKVALDSFAADVGIMRQIGQIVRRGVQHYILDIKLEAEKILMDPILLEQFGVLSILNVPVIPFLLDTAPKIMQIGVCQQIEGAQYLYYLMSHFRSAAECIWSGLA